MSSDNYFQQKHQEQVDQMVAVGFTVEQSELLLALMQTKAMSGGLF
jgi:hypothetical protein